MKNTQPITMRRQQLDAPREIDLCNHSSTIICPFFLTDLSFKLFFVVVFVTYPSLSLLIAQDWKKTTLSFKKLLSIISRFASEVINHPVMLLYKNICIIKIRITFIAN